MAKLAPLRAEGLELAIFPSGEFGNQELGSDAEIVEFAKGKAFASSTDGMLVAVGAGGSERVVVPAALRATVMRAFHDDAGGRSRSLPHTSETSLNTNQSAWRRSADRWDAGKLPSWKTTCGYCRSRENASRRRCALSRNAA